MVRCDVTDPQSVRDAFAQVVTMFGGLDILVSNAGAAWQGRIGEVDEKVLRESFELNFYGHQRVAQAAVNIMLAQGTGGCLLFNVSKQAVNPGRTSVLMVCPRPRPCCWCASTRSTTGRTAFAPTP